MTSVVNRRAFLSGASLSLVTLSRGTQAQPAGPRPKIGALAVFGEPHPTVEAFRQALRDMGYVEGSNIAVDIRYAQGRIDQYPRLVADTIKGQPDLIVVWGTDLAQAARRATTTIPIVLALADRPVEMGLVASLARPGGNVTGLTSLNFELSTKRVELLKEVLPKLSRVAILYGPDPRIVPTLNEIRVATRAVGIQVRSLEVRGPEDFERALDQILRERADGLVTTPSAVIAAHILRLGDLVLKRRLPWITTGRSIIAAGALMAYGADIVDMSRHAAIFVDKILKGARPADLPVEQPTKFELFVNLKTAKALGLTIPPAVLARADEVIQ